MTVFTPPTLPVIPPVSISDRRTGPPTQQSNPLGYRLMRYFYNTNSSFQRSRGVNVWRMNDGTYQMSDPVPGVAFTGTIAWPYPDTDKPVNNAISSSWFSGAPGPATALGANELSAADSGFEFSLIGWTGQSNTSAFRTSSHARTGSFSLQIQALGSGNIGTILASTNYTVGPNLPYSVTGYVMAAATPRVCRAGLEWFDANGNLIPPSINGLGVTDTTTGWTQVSVLGAYAPATASYVQPFYTVAGCASGEQHYLDDVTLATGGAATVVNGSGPGGSQQPVTPGIAIEYLGGHSYAVSSAEAANLTAVGLGAYVV